MHWVVLRDEKIHAKGKGELETYWLDLKIQSSGSARSGQSGKSGGSASTSSNVDVAGTITSALQGRHLETNDKVHIDAVLPPKIKRLVKWNADVLLRVLKQVVARREAIEALASQDDSENPDLGSSFRDASKAALRRTTSIDGKTCMDEVKEIIELPKFNAKAAKIQKDASEVELDSNVVQQLHDYITVIASMYRVDVPFHNVSSCTLPVISL